MSQGRSSEYREKLRSGDKSKKQRKDSAKKSTKQESMADLQSLSSMISGLTTTVNGIKDDITEMKRSKSETLNQFKNETVKIRMLSAIVIRQDARIEQLKNQVKSLLRSTRRPNLMIQGIIETAEQSKEDRIKLVKDFFTSELEIEETISIKNAYWRGQGKARHMFTELEHYSDKSLIFTNVSKLKGKKNVKRQLFRVSDDDLEEEREHRNYYRSLVRDNLTKDEDDRLSIKLKKGRLLVNNEIIQPKVYPPKPIDVLTLQPEELNEIHEVRTCQVETHEEKGSEFICHLQKVKSVRDVQQGLAKMKIKYGDAAHTVVSYRLDNPQGPFKQGFQEDGEFGAGWRMLEEMQNMGDSNNNLAIYVARYSDGSKMGPRRFEVYKDMVKKACKKFREKQERLVRVNRLRRSQSQTSMLSMDEEEVWPAESAGENHNGEEPLMNEQSKMEQAQAL